MPIQWAICFAAVVFNGWLLTCNLKSTGPIFTKSSGLVEVSESLTNLIRICNPSTDIGMATNFMGPSSEIGLSTFFPLAFWNGLEHRCASVHVNSSDDLPTLGRNFRVFNTECFYRGVNMWIVKNWHIWPVMSEFTGPVFTKFVMLVDGLWYCGPETAVVMTLVSSTCTFVTTKSHCPLTNLRSTVSWISATGCLPMTQTQCW